MRRLVGISIFALLLLLVAAWPNVGAQTQHSIAVTWTYTQGTDAATGFNVYRGTVSGGPYTKQNSTPLALTPLSYSDTTGVGGTTYYYVVTAVDKSGDESAFSAQASAAMLSNPSVPQGVVATSN